MYLIRAEEEKQKQANQPLFPFVYKDSPFPVVLQTKILVQVLKYFTILHCKLQYSAELLQFH